MHECESLFSGKNKKSNNSLSSAEFAKRVVKKKTESCRHWDFFF